MRINSFICFHIRRKCAIRELFWRILFCPSTRCFVPLHCAFGAAGQTLIKIVTDCCNYSLSSQFPTALDSFLLLSTLTYGLWWCSCANWQGSRCGGWRRDFCDLAAQWRLCDGYLVYEQRVKEEPIRLSFIGLSLSREIRKYLKQHNEHNWTLPGDS